MEAFERAFGTEAENLAQRMERNDSKKEKTNPVENELQKLSSQVNQLEGRVLELQTKLKETIVSVEKLAKGKSLGALGLPPLEAWDPPA